MEQLTYLRLLAGPLAVYHAFLQADESAQGCVGAFSHGQCAKFGAALYLEVL